jgi:hypothetical protein
VEDGHVAPKMQMPVHALNISPVCVTLAVGVYEMCGVRQI